MTEPFLLTPHMPGDNVDDVTFSLSDTFVEIVEALDEGRPVAVIVRATDLEGQGKPADAAVAAGALGMVRTFGIEGAKPGWRVNVIALGSDDDDADVSDLVTALAAAPVTGQLLQLGGANLGKVPA